MITSENDISATQIGRKLVLIRDASTGEISSNLRSRHHHHVWLHLSLANGIQLVELVRGGTECFHFGGRYENATVKEIRHTTWRNLIGR